MAKGLEKNTKNSPFLATKAFSTSFAIILWEYSNNLLKLSCDILNFLNKSTRSLLNYRKNVSNKKCFEN